MNHPDADSLQLTWRKSSRSGGGNQCVEVAFMDMARAVRDSKNPHGGHLTMSPSAWRTLIGAIKHGDHDL
jgi:Domain of unknown function (DUF397).